MPVRIRPNRSSTHYENLKVSEKAPVEVIKAAYRVLSMRWHPDKNPGDPQAVRMMRVLNEAYEVLSDPVRRQEYDASLPSSRPASITSARNPSPASAWSPKKSRPAFFSIVVRNMRRWDLRWLLAGAALIVAGFGVFQLTTTVHHYLAKKAELAAAAPSQVSAVDENAVSPEALSQHPTLDLRFSNPLNGQPWPKRASYLPGFEKLATDGYSSVTVDNSKNTSDVFLKLVSAENRQASKVMRVCFIPARSAFTFYRVTPGRYELLYQEVEDGACLKTETFVLSQTKRSQGGECTRLNVPLYGLPGRSVNLLQSNEREFIAAAPAASR
jgi:hypothetical protein